MRIIKLFTLALCLTAGILAQSSPQTPMSSNSPDAVLGASRKALGGDKLMAVRNFVATGRTKQIRGNNLVPIEFEIACELPDKYIRKDEVPAQESDPSTLGFNGDELIQIPAPPPPVARADGPAPPEQLAMQAVTARRTRVTTIKQDFARLTLGMFANSFNAYPLTFTYAGVAEAPQGKADVIDAKGDGPLTLRLFINTDTHLPLMVSWTQPPTQVIVTVPGQKAQGTVPPGAAIVEGPPAPSADAAKEVKDKYVNDVADLKKATQTKPVEYRVYYADYRDIGGGIMWPFRLRRAIGPDTTEETTFDGFKINGKIDAKKFEVVK